MPFKILTLYELNTLVKETIEISFPNEYWVEAELSEVREVRGHCYMQLIQKDIHSNVPIAQASAKCWKSQWMEIRPHFEQSTGQRLRPGLKVLIQVHPQFHENFGFSWIVTDIDPTYTMGDMARKRQEIIKQLKEEGVFELNKELPLPLFTQRIAVISSQQAAGFGDFMNQLLHNEYGFAFDVKLFPAVMQGEQTESSVINALNQINDALDHFDCVVLIRGGGAVADLSGFDTLTLAENVANFPLPIITGIGHERDESILDMISNTRVKTPTAAAAFLIDRLRLVEERIIEAQNRIANTVKQRMNVENMRLGRLTGHIPMLFSLVQTRQQARLDRIFTKLRNSMAQALSLQHHHIHLFENRLLPALDRLLLKESHRLQLLKQRTDAANPEHLLKRGYSITLLNGKSIRDPKQLKAGDEIETRVEKGILHSIIK